MVDETPRRDFSYKQNLKLLNMFLMFLALLHSLADVFDKIIFVL